MYSSDDAKKSNYGNVSTPITVYFGLELTGYGSSGVVYKPKKGGMVDLYDKHKKKLGTYPSMESAQAEADKIFQQQHETRKKLLGVKHENRNFYYRAERSLG